MARIDRAKAKAAGYSDSEIDAFEQSGAGGTPPPTTGNEGIVGKIAGFLTNLVKPTTDYAKGLVTGETGPAAALNELKQMQESGQVKTGIESLQLVPYLLAKTAKQQIKPAANIASLLPVTAGAGFLPGAIQGASSGALMEFSQQDKLDPTRIMSAAITGGVAGGVLNKVLGPGAGQAGKDFEREVQRKIISPQGGKGPTAFAKEEDLLTSALEYGKEYGVNIGKGSAESQRRALPELVTRMSQDLEKTAASSSRSVSKSAALSTLKKEVRDAGDNFIKGDKTHENILSNLMQTLRKNVDGSKITDTEVLSMKRLLNNKFLGKAWGKLALKTALTAKEEVAMDAWNVLDNALSPAAKAVSRKISKIYDLSPDIAASAQYGLFAPLAGRVGFAGQVVQGAGSRIGQAAGDLGRAQSAIGNSPLAKFLPGLGAAGVVRSPAPNPEDNPSPLLPEQYQIAKPQAVSGGLDDDAVRKLMISDLLTTGGKNISNIKAIAEIGAPTAAKAKRITAVNSALNVYDTVAALSASAPTGTSGWVQALAGKIPGVEGGSAEDLDRVTDGMAKVIASAFAGEVGVATDTDIKRWKGLLPKPSDTAAERQRALLRLKQTIESEMSTLGLR